jgi:lipoprotein-anchoring transpeptidase ErfK/SrfK
VGLLLVGVAALGMQAPSLWRRFGEPEASLRLTVDLSRRELTVYEDGQPTVIYPVAVGRRKNPTPTGAFTIKRVVWNPAWVPPNSPWAKGAKRAAPGDPENPMQGVKMYFLEDGYYIHGTNNPESIGEAASHGCVRMATRDAEALAQLVMEHGGASRSEAWYREVMRSDEERKVKLPRPVPLTITG